MRVFNQYLETEDKQDLAALYKLENELEFLATQILRSVLLKAGKHLNKNKKFETTHIHDDDEASSNIRFLIDTVNKLDVNIEPTVLIHWNDKMLLEEGLLTHEESDALEAQLLSDFSGKPEPDAGL